MVCSERYVAKANAGQGGVGYEKMIMTSSLLTKIDSSKIIPIIRENPHRLLPTFMSSKLYIDFSSDRDIEYSLDELLRTLLNAPLFEKPGIGSNPFRPLEQSKPDRVSDGLKEAMRAISDAFNSTAAQRVTIRELMNHSSMHRLTLERYLSVAVKEQLVIRDIIANYTITNKGIEYLIDHGLIDA